MKHLFEKMEIAIFCAFLLRYFGEKKHFILLDLWSKGKKSKENEKKGHFFRLPPIGGFHLVDRLDFFY